MTVSERAQNIRASVTLAISARAKKMREDGVKVINFTVGEPDFNTPDYIINAAKRALDEGKTKYTATAGILPLRKAICEKLKRDNGLTYEPNQIVVSNGAKQALAGAILALINPGDEVIIPAPYWITYPELVKLAGGVPVFVEDLESLPAAITSKTKVILINSPNNPTGAVYTERELRALAKVVREDIFIISDEIYEHLIYGTVKHFSIARVHPRTVVINGFSKTYSMTGWRIGYAAAPAEVAAAIDSIQGHLTSNVNTMTQYAGLEALTNPAGKDFTKQMVTEFNRRRQYMLERFKKLPGIIYNTPDGAFYIMVKTNLTAETLLDKIHIATVPGEAFGAPGYIRFCYTVSMEDTKEGMDRLEAFLKD